MNNSLDSALELFASHYKIDQLAQAREELTRKYRDPNRHGQPTTFMTTSLHRAAYVLTRMPATYAVIRRVLNSIKARTEHSTIETLLDLGSGPGTALWAAFTEFPEIKQAVALEQDKELIAIGKKLMENLPSRTLWQHKNITSQDYPEADLTIISYAIGELSSEAQEIVLQKAWESTRQLLVLIEPGTKPGFACIRKARETLLQIGAYPLAPCPHAAACPMPQNDWCHFSERLERSALHRKLKSGDLGYEDEKYAYFVASKVTETLPSNRILRHPQKHSGHIQFELCTPQGLQKRTISKKEGNSYKLARKTNWGDVLED